MQADVLETDTAGGNRTDAKSAKSPVIRPLKCPLATGLRVFNGT
jgi:hypothetical protein